MVYWSPSPLQSLVSAPICHLLQFIIQNMALPDVFGLICQCFFGNLHVTFLHGYFQVLLYFPINTLTCKIYSLVIPTSSLSSSSSFSSSSCGGYDDHDDNTLYINYVGFILFARRFGSWP
jgi:hypothetical protein